LKALAKNWRQKARISARGPDRPPRLRGGEEREPDVMVAMTNPVFFRRLLSRGALSGALTGSFGRELLKEGFNCRYPCSYW
jgi:hypothetical protein